MIISVEKAIEATKEGKLLIIVDDRNRENEGDFFVATEKLTPEIVNFMATAGKGLICVSLSETRLSHLGFEPMCKENTSIHGTAFFCSCEAKEGVTTGISAYDRCITMLKLVDSNATRNDFLFPGHVFPLRAKNGGVLTRLGHTEASADLAALAGLTASGVIVEIMDTDGRMARFEKLEEMAQQYNIGIVTIEDIAQFRKESNLTTQLY